MFEFPTGLGAADLLTALTHEWLTAINGGGAVRALAVDIAGAFDKSSHAGVLHKLKSYGIQDTLHTWLTNSLTNRKIQAVVRGATSAPFPVSVGVPQGSILGPTLFLVYANDAADVLPEGVTPATYADDTTLYCIIRSSATAESQCLAFQTGVDNLATWGAKWRVQFEPAKSQALTITRHRIPWPIAPVQFSGLAVEEVCVLKLLGVTFDKHLFYDPICNASPFVLLNGSTSFENLSRCWTLMAALLLTRDSSARCWSIANWSGLVQLPTTSLASTKSRSAPSP